MAFAGEDRQATRRSDSITLLEQISKIVKVDAETPEIDFIRSLPIKVVDCSSNPRFLYDAITDPVNKELIESVIREHGKLPFEQLYPRLFGRFHSTIIPHISGRVVASAYTSVMDDVEKLVQCAREYIRGWEAEGVHRDRVCIKFCLTGNGAAAGAILSKEGICTSGTAVFSVEQAVAAQQAGMDSIHLYWNNPVDSASPETWPDVEDPATQHPFASRHARIRRVYDELAKQGEKIPSIHTSAYQSGREVVATIELGADHVTVIKLILDDMAAGHGLPEYRKGAWRVPIQRQMQQPGFKLEAWQPVDPAISRKRVEGVIKQDPLTWQQDEDWLQRALSTDYLAAGVLDRCISNDKSTRERLFRKLGQFTDWEQKTRDLVDDLKKQLL